MSRFIPSTDAGFLAAQKMAWSCPPIDGVGYISSADLLSKSDDDLRSVIAALEVERYAVDGWRNHANRWRDFLGLDNTHGKRVLDYGCGCGVEALQFARTENVVYLADIVADNVALASRVLKVHGFKAENEIVLSGDPPDMLPEIDVFYSAGVLHHIPRARDVLLGASKALASDGEIRLMLYTDNGWMLTTNSPTPPVSENVETNEHFHKFVGIFDAVGGYTDWYNAEKLTYRFGDFLDLVRFEYICSDDVYSVAVLRPKS